MIIPDAVCDSGCTVPEWNPKESGETCCTDRYHLPAFHGSLWQESLQDCLDPLEQSTESSLRSDCRRYHRSPKHLHSGNSSGHLTGIEPAASWTPILSPRLFVLKNKEIIQLFRAFAIFRIIFIAYFPYIPLAFRLYSASVAGEERVTTRPPLERILLHPLSNRRAKSLLLVALLNRTLMRFRLFIVVDSN